MKDTSYSKAISGSGVWWCSPSWERPTALAASQFVWSDPFTFSVSGWDSASPNQYFHLLTTNISNFTPPVSVQVTQTAHFLPAFSPAVAPRTPGFHGQHLDLLLLCWYLCEQEQWPLQRLSTIPQTALTISFEIITVHLHLPERKENSRKQIHHNIEMLPEHR